MNPRLTVDPTLWLGHFIEMWLTYQFPLIQTFNRTWGKACNFSTKLNRDPFFFSPFNALPHCWSWELSYYVLCSFYCSCVELTSSAQTSSICCLCNTFSCVATLSELNGSQKFRILQTVLSGERNWQRNLVSVTEILLPDREHQVLLDRCHTTGDNFICIFLPVHNLKTTSLPLLAFQCYTS